MIADEQTLPMYMTVLTGDDANWLVRACADDRPLGKLQSLRVWLLSQIGREQERRDNINLAVAVVGPIKPTMPPVIGWSSDDLFIALRSLTKMLAAAPSAAVRLLLYAAAMACADELRKRMGIGGSRLF